MIRNFFLVGVHWHSCDAQGPGSIGFASLNSAEEYGNAYFHSGFSSAFVSHLGRTMEGVVRNRALCKFGYVAMDGGGWRRGEIGSQFGFSIHRTSHGRAGCIL